MSVLMALVAAGAVLVNMILSVSACRLCTLVAISLTKALNLLNVAMVHPHDGGWRRIAIAPAGPRGGAAVVSNRHVDGMELTGRRQAPTARCSICGFYK